MLRNREECIISTEQNRGIHLSRFQHTSYFADEDNSQIRRKRAPSAYITVSEMQPKLNQTGLTRTCYGCYNAGNVGQVIRSQLNSLP